jgi:O-antigen/teichoic acid export membrane protein
MMRVDSAFAGDGYIRKVAVSSLFNSTISALATALLLPVVISAVGLATYGVWSVLAIFVGIAAVLDFGIWKSLVYFIPRGEYPPNQLFWSCMLLITAISLAFLAIFGLLLLADFPLFGRSITAQGDLTWWLAAGGCVVVIANLLTNLARGMLEAAYRGHWVNVGFGLLTVVQYGLAAIIAHRTHDPRALIAGSAAVYGIVLTGHWLCLDTASLKWARPRRDVLASILRYASASFLADAPSTLLGPIILYVFLLVSSSPSQYGIFDISVRIATLAATTLGMFSAPFFVLVSAAAIRGQREVRRRIQRQLRVTSVLAVVGCLVFWGIGRPILRVFFAEGSDQIFRASFVMMIGTATVAALEPIARMLLGIGKLTALSIVRFAMLASVLLCVAVLTRVDPLNRFSIAMSIGFLVSAAGLVLLNRSENWGAVP